VMLPAEPPPVVAQGTAIPPAGTREPPSPERRATRPADPAPAPAPRPGPAPDTEKLVTRARALLGNGDVSGARLLLQRAADGGDPRAMVLLAQTYDDAVLRSWNVRGLKADPERARALYEKARRAGVAGLPN
jgi:TPR repeat protein